MARDTYPPCADICSVNDRCGLRVIIAVCSSGAARLVFETTLLSACSASVVSKCGKKNLCFAVSIAVRRAGGRRSIAADAAARRKHYGGWHDHGNGDPANSTRLSCGCKPAAAVDAVHAQRFQKEKPVHDGHRTAEEQDLSYACADRQRKSAQRAGFRTSGLAAQSCAGCADTSDSVCERRKRRLTVWRARQIADPAGLRRRDRRLLLRRIAAADRRRAGDPAGICIAAQMEDGI